MEIWIPFGTPRTSLQVMLNEAWMERARLEKRDEDPPRSFAYSPTATPDLALACRRVYEILNQLDREQPDWKDDGPTGKAMLP